MSAFVAHVDRSVRQRGLLKPGAGVLVAVSGGVDSMVLLHALHALHALASRNRWRLVAAHYDHGLRGSASAGDARFVQRAAARLGLECVVESGDVQALARARGWSVEMAARELRHEFLARTAKRLGLATVALAHHADDQVELFFLRLLRGAGGGLAGMKWKSPSPADATVNLIRPLLDQPKAALLAWACREKIRFRRDATNLQQDILRNRVRHELLPLLRRYQPGLHRTVQRTMELAGAETEFALEAARAWRARSRRGAFARLAVAVQRQCVCLELHALGLAADFELVERLRLQPQVKHSWKNGWLLRRADGTVSWEQPTDKAVEPKPQTVKLTARRGTRRFGDLMVEWSFCAGQGSLAQPRKVGEERFDAVAVGPQVRLRRWQAGDRFRPIGMPRAVKLQDLFTNAKVSAAERRRRLVAEAADGRVFWVEGLRMSEDFKLTPATRRVLVWRWRLAPI